MLCMRLLREGQTVHYPVQRYKEKPFIPLTYSEKLFLSSRAPLLAGPKSAFPKRL